MKYQFFKIERHIKQSFRNMTLFNETIVPVNFGLLAGLAFESQEAACDYFNKNEAHIKSELSIDNNAIGLVLLPVFYINGKK
jgi:hypothetical protein